MSVLIKGFEMPEDGHILLLVIKSDGKVIGDNSGEEVLGRAVEVPTPHGDLIDRDAIPWRNANHPTAGKWVDEAHIRIMPTIVEAEVEHDNR